MTENERDEWNAAVRAAQADPTPENFAVLDRLRRQHLDQVHCVIMTQDRYQARTH
jgi:hypothetical protein